MQDKSFVVIGGTTGLGLAAAEAIVAAGARVLVVGRNAQNTDAAVETLGAPCRGLSADATDPDTAGRAIAMAAKAFGRFEVVGDDRPVFLEPLGDRDGQDVQEQSFRFQSFQFQHGFRFLSRFT